MTDVPAHSGPEVDLPPQLVDAIQKLTGAIKDEYVNIEHPVARAIVRFLHRARDIEECGRVYIPLARQRREEFRDELVRELALAGTEQVAIESDHTVFDFLIRRLTFVLHRLERLGHSRVVRMLTVSLFQGLFSVFDTLVGELLSALYQRRPALFARLQRTMTISEILAYGSFDDLRTDILRREIDSFRRKSYVEQFSELETGFELKLRVFEHWPQFVECSQRRNILTHCDGVISEQYLKTCADVGYTFPQPVKVGDLVTIDEQYLLSACGLVMEVGLKLAQTLWRKVLPEELSDADKYLGRVIYGCLKDENWASARVYADFALAQRKMSSDLDRRIATINYAIALKFGGASDAATETLASIDWTGAALDFVLAVEVLRENYDEAAETMERIGRSGVVLSEDSYHAWPLFRDFRSSKQFRQAYERIYGRGFGEALRQAAEAAVRVAEAEPAVDP